MLQLFSSSTQDGIPECNKDRWIIYYFILSSQLLVCSKGAKTCPADYFQPMGGRGHIQNLFKCFPISGG